LIDCSTYNVANQDLFLNTDYIVDGDGSPDDGPSLEDLIGRYNTESTNQVNPDGLDLSP
jgi:hypothetical protein